jgi:hypothetical protein
MWIHEHLTGVAKSYNNPEIADAVLATATLIDFPGFRDVHDSIFEAFGNRRYRHYPFDPQQWETYVKYRQFLSEFLTDRAALEPFLLDQPITLILLNAFGPSS